jgi:anti-sigma factor RsiW
MNVTKDVIQDLVVVYLSGEASADTRSLVEEYLAQNPEMAERVKGAQAFTVPQAAPPPSLERRALDRTRQLLSRKSFLLWFAMILSYLPLSFSYTTGEKSVQFLFLDKPVFALALLPLGLAGWAAFLYTCRQLQATGLEPAKSWKRRSLWWLGGMAVAVPLFTVIAVATGWSRLYYYVPLAGLIAIFVGEMFGQIAKPSPKPPISLLGSK